MDAPTDRPRLLIVDDDAALARVAARMFAHSCDISLAHSIEAALEALRAPGRFDAIWSDRNLPEANGGVQVLRAAAELHPTAVLLMVSGSPDPDGGAKDLPAHVRVFHKDDVQRAVRYVGEMLEVPTLARPV